LSEDQNSKQLVEVSLGWMDALSLFSSIASLVMGGLAIWLSITFYKMSDKSSREIESSSSKINSNVEKLEKLFDKMYSDTFGMVKDTVSHMRQQVDRTVIDKKMNEDEVEKRTKEAVTVALKGIKSENLTKEEAEDLFLHLFKESKETEIEVKTNSLKDKIKEYLTIHGETTYIDLRNNILGQDPLAEEFSMFFDTLKSMADSKIINNKFSYDPEEGGYGIGIKAKIRLLP
jgi:hypothetical protein